MDNLTRHGIEHGRQYELFAALDRCSFVQQDCRRDLGEGLAARCRESVAELLYSVPNGDVGAFDTVPAHHLSSLAEALVNFALSIHLGNE